MQDPMMDLTGLYTNNYFLSNASLNLPATSCRCKRVVWLGAKATAALISAIRLLACPFSNEDASVIFDAPPDGALPIPGTAAAGGGATMLINASTYPFCNMRRCASIALCVVSSLQIPFFRSLIISAEV